MLCAIFSHFSPITMFTQLQIQLSQLAFLDGIDGGRRTLKKSKKIERNSQKLVHRIREVQKCVENILKKSLKFYLFQFPRTNSAPASVSPKCSQKFKKTGRKKSFCVWVFTFRDSEYMIYPTFNHLRNILLFTQLQDLPKTICSSKTTSFRSYEIFTQ